ncbi:MAG: dehydrogenase [Chlorobiaceae bacterium]|nr:dehydrogenase [Chlorobiaceae bacterium]MBA4308762.1 dehydrogenase [Chlorobiaceae bacterium]
MNFENRNYPNQFLVELFKELLLPRLIEEKMLNLLRQGKITKWFSGIGQEAISVGVARALNNDEYILPLIRNLGIFTSRKISLEKLFLQIQGKRDGFTKGRDRSFHFGTKEHHIVGMISHLGPQLAVADGIALWDKIQKEKKVTLVFSGDGGTSEGDFHEGLNLAAVWNLPVIFVVENNGYGLSTPPHEQYKCKQLIDKGIGYGIDAHRVDGNNVLEVYELIKYLAENIRENPKPVLVEAMTFRMRGHEEASGIKYVPKELLNEWSQKDPILNFENYLLSKNIITEIEISKVKDELKTFIIDAWEKAEAVEDRVSSIQEEEKDVFKINSVPVTFPQTENKSDKKFINAISDALTLSMEKFPELILMGQDIAEYGGAFKVTEGFVNKFGKERVRNTPLCESAIVGAGLGYSIKGGKAVVEVQFSDFATCGFNQIVNNLAKIYYRWGQNADVVIRMPCGAGVGAGPFHSQTNEAWFTHTPGLKVVYPSNPFDAKGLLIASIEDPNPVLFFEHKTLYRSMSDLIPDDYYSSEIGKAKLVHDGNDLLIITYGIGVNWATSILKNNKNISAKVLDLKTLIPWDKEIVFNLVKKMGKVILLNEANLTGSFINEISSWISENCFEYLDAPVMREGSLDTPIPFSIALEKQFLPIKRFEEKLIALSKY